MGFYYGNYDGLSKPPKFDLFINNVKWTTVDTSINNGGPFYKEIIYQNKESGFFKICLVQIKDGGIPIINSIESMVIFDELYPRMETDATFNLIARTNLGGPEVRYMKFFVLIFRSLQPSRHNFSSHAKFLLYYKPTFLNERANRILQ